MTQKYEWLGDVGELVGHAVFAAGSRGQIVELEEPVADRAIEDDGFPLRKIVPAEPEKEVNTNGSI